MVLLVVDTQKGCFNENLYSFETVAYKYYNEFMWPKRYAKIITVEQAVQLLKSEITL